MTDHDAREALIARLRRQVEAANSTMERIADQGLIESGHVDAVDEHHEAYESAEVGRLTIAALEASRPSYQPPPDGWFEFGSHAGFDWINLEFSEEVDDGGMPRWERPSRPSPATVEAVADDDRHAAAFAVQHLIDKHGYSSVLSRDGAGVGLEALLERLLTPAPVVTEEWEYAAIRPPQSPTQALVPAAGVIYRAKSREDAERWVRENPKYMVHQRTPEVSAGPWTPVLSAALTPEAGQ